MIGIAIQAQQDFNPIGYGGRPQTASLFLDPFTQNPAQAPSHQNVDTKIIILPMSNGAQGRMLQA